MGIKILRVSSFDCPNKIDIMLSNSLDISDGCNDKKKKEKKQSESTKW